jgi:hypothetical protein
VAEPVLDHGHVHTARFQAPERIGSLIRAGASVSLSGRPRTAGLPPLSPGACPCGARRARNATPSPPPPNPRFGPPACAGPTTRARPRPLPLGGSPPHPTGAAAHGPARASTPRRSRCARTRRTTAGSVTNPTSRAAAATPAVAS